MDYPANIQTAFAVQEQIKKTGAIPATIALIKGRIKVGLTKEEIDYLGKAGHKV